MTIPLQTAEPTATQGPSREELDALARLGAELLRRAEESQPAMETAWDRLISTCGIQGEPVGVQGLREMIQEDTGSTTGGNEFSRELIALREERQ